jgi:hypothetical protein
MSTVIGFRLEARHVRRNLSNSLQKYRPSVSSLSHRLPSPRDEDLQVIKTEKIKVGNIRRPPWILQAEFLSQKVAIQVNVL